MDQVCGNSFRILFSSCHILRDRTTSTVTDAPFPDLTEACHDLVEVMTARGLGQGQEARGQGQEDTGEGEEGRLGLTKRAARWGYYHGRRDLQGYFIKHS